MDHLSASSRAELEAQIVQFLHETGRNKFDVVIEHGKVSYEAIAYVTLLSKPFHGHYIDLKVQYPRWSSLVWSMGAFVAQVSAEAGYKTRAGAGGRKIIYRAENGQRYSYANLFAVEIDHPDTWWSMSLAVGPTQSNHPAENSKGGRGLPLPSMPRPDDGIVEITMNMDRIYSDETELDAYRANWQQLQQTYQEQSAEDALQLMIQLHQDAVSNDHTTNMIMSTVVNDMEHVVVHSRRNNHRSTLAHANTSSLSTKKRKQRSQHLLSDDNNNDEAPMTVSFDINDDELLSSLFLGDVMSAVAPQQMPMVMTQDEAMTEFDQLLFQLTETPSATAAYMDCSSSPSSSATKKRNSRVRNTKRRATNTAMAKLHSANSSSGTIAATMFQVDPTIESLLQVPILPPIQSTVDDHVCAASVEKTLSAQVSSVVVGFNMVDPDDNNAIPLAVDGLLLASPLSPSLADQYMDSFASILSPFATNFADESQQTPSSPFHHQSPDVQAANNSTTEHMQDLSSQSLGATSTPFISSLSFDVESMMMDSHPSNSMDLLNTTTSWTSSLAPMSPVIAGY